MAKNKGGAPKKINSPKHLWELAEEYFKDVKDNPIIVEDNKGTKHVNEVKLKRPFTWDAFENYVYDKTGLVRLDDYKSNKNDAYKDFSDIVHVIGRIIRNQKFEGATVGIFNSNIIARDLGLRDNQDITSAGKRMNSNITVQIIETDT